MDREYSENIYILSGNESKYREMFAAQGIKVCEDRSQATILLADPPLAAEALDEFPNLRWLQSTFAGVDALMVDGLRRDYQLTNIKGVFGQLIAEYVMGYLLQGTRHFNDYKWHQQNREWAPKYYTSLSEMTMVILGTGMIGAHLSMVAKAFGMQVIGVSRSGQIPENSAFNEVFTSDEITQAMAKADVVVSTLPSTPETKGILCETTLSHCKEVLLFNVGRGSALKEDELIRLIEQGAVKHAYLDVFVQEPLVDEHPFWSHPNISITPHIAAVSFPEQVITIFQENLARWRAQKPLNFSIDFIRGY